MAIVTCIFEPFRIVSDSITVYFRCTIRIEHGIKYRVADREIKLNYSQYPKTILYIVPPFYYRAQLLVLPESTVVDRKGYHVT